MVCWCWLSFVCCSFSVDRCLLPAICGCSLLMVVSSMFVAVDCCHCGCVLLCVVYLLSFGVVIGCFLLFAIARSDVYVAGCLVLFVLGLLIILCCFLVVRCCLLCVITCLLWLFIAVVCSSVLVVVCLLCVIAACCV